MLTGSVAAIRNVAHPVDVARLVMEKTSHVMLVGEGAKRFASEQGVPEVSVEKLVTEFAKATLERTQKTGVSAASELGYVAEDQFMRHTKIRKDKSTVSSRHVRSEY
jgi:isoaspartyl peptidase/L-asparaginase-like protein (Ntn-hydrolase superfamily)